MTEIKLSRDQEKAFQTIAKWLANGGKVLRKQKNPKLLTLGGFAGTGKTTLISKIAKEFGSSINFAFCALSGRAASNIGNKLKDHGVLINTDGGHFCGTIHSLIYQPIQNDDGEVLYWARRPTLTADFIILDEASMVSRDIYLDLASYGIDILAVGDHGQLPPIEGKFSLMDKPHLKLEKIHRQAEDNPIINLSMQIRNAGCIPKDIKENEHIKIVKRKDYIDFLEEVYSNKPGPEEILESAVLCYTNYTRSNINKIVRQLVFGTYSKIPLSDDIVICLRNATKDRKIPLYNGFRGYLIGAAEEEGEDFFSAKIKFPFENFEVEEDSLCRYQFGYPKTFNSFSELEEFGMEIKDWKQAGLLFDYGYAMTVHKSQGSQMNNVILFNERPKPVTDDNYKRWLYTGITRSSNKLTLVI